MFEISRDKARERCAMLVRVGSGTFNRFTGHADGQFAFTHTAPLLYIIKIFVRLSSRKERKHSRSPSSAPLYCQGRQGREERRPVCQGKSVCVGGKIRASSRSPLCNLRNLRFSFLRRPSTATPAAFPLRTASHDRASGHWASGHRTHRCASVDTIKASHLPTSPSHPNSSPPSRR